MTVKDRSIITSHNRFAKALKTLDILQIECELIIEPTFKTPTHSKPVHSSI